MLIRAIKAVLTVDASQFDRALKEATGAVKSLGYESERLGGKQSGISKLASSLRENSAAWDDIGNKALLAGGAIAAGLGLATKAAISWESAFAGVRKTTEATEAQYAELERGLRDLAKVLPATHEEIAGVAEAAGQLGIQRENILSFTRTMIDMGEATNLSADDAATAMARFANVMGTSQAEFSNIGSAIVSLGNNFATTESEIMAMASRLSGAGRQAKMTEADILGIAAAMSSVGIEAEAGGTAMSRVIIEIGKAVDTGNEKLETFARTAGMSVDAFSQLWSENSGEALTRFIEGLGEIQARGESLEPILAELGMTDIRVGDALRKAAASSDLFTEAMRLANQAYAENNALTEEAEQRYETAASKIAIAQNTVKDAAIDIGGALAPFVVAFAEGIASIADGFSSLPAPIQQATAGIATLTGGALLFVGTGIKVARAIQETHDAMSSLAGSSNRVAAGLGRLGTAAGVAVGVAAVGFAIGALHEAALPAAEGVEELQAALISLTQGSATDLNQILYDLGEQAGLMRVLMGQVALDVNNLSEALDRIDNRSALEWISDLNDGVQRFFGMTTEVDQARAVFERLGETLVKTANEAGPEVAAGMFKALADEIGGGEEAVQRLLNVMPAYAAYLQDIENQSEMTASGAEEVNEALAAQAEEAQKAADAFNEMLSAITMLGGGLRAEREAIVQANQAIADAAEVAKDSTATWEEQDAALRAISERYLGLASIMAENGRGISDVTAAVSQGRDAFLAAAADMGIPAAAAEALADAYGLIPSDVRTMVEVGGVEESTAEVLALDEAIFRLDGKIVTVEEEGANPSKGRVLELDGAIFGLKGKTVEVEEIGALASGERVVRLDGVIYALKGKTVEVIADVRGAAAVDELRRKVEGLSNKQITVGVNYLQRGQIGITNADGGLLDKTRLGMVKRYASGGFFDGSFVGQQPRVRPYSGPQGVLWGEEGSGPWEAFISGHPAKRSRSRAIADDVVARLGGRIDWIAAYANGGIREVATHHYYAPTPPAASSSPGMVRLDPGDIDRLAVEVGRRVEAGANRGLQQIGRGL